MSGAAAIRAQISELASDISLQEQRLDVMRTRLQGLQGQLDSVTYPILSLPLEITSEIFLHCIPFTRYWDVVNTSEAPLLLTRVCQAWRQIALSLPALWTTLDVDCVEDLYYLSTIARTWFERAQNCSLSVRICGQLGNTDSFRWFMETFCDHSHKMRSLELHMEEPDFAEMGVHRIDFPLLQRLSIRLEDDPAESESSIIEVSTQNAPLLHEVSMRIPPSAVLLPWQQLTKFTGELYSLVDYLDAIRLMPNLIECAFSSYGPEDDELQGLEAASHPNLQHLTLFETISDEGVWASSVRALTLVTLPALRTLEILGVDDFNPDEFDVFLERSSPGLQKLAIRHVDFESGIILNVNSGTACCLVDLEIWRPSGSYIFVFFEIFGQYSSFLPQLQKLSFLDCPVVDCLKEEADVYEILHNASESIPQRNRLAGCRELQSFRVVSNLGAWYSEEEILPFRKLKESGMDIYIGTDRRSVV